MTTFNFVILNAIALSVMSNAQPITERFSSVAHDKVGKVSYQEQHEVVFNEKKVQKSNTQYLDKSGKIIGTLSSDYTKLITIPEYEYKDFRTSTSHGIRLEGEKIVLWKKNKEGKLEESSFLKDDFSKDTLLVGCQGLHYYLVDNLGFLKEKKSIPIKYFMPGKLDYYSFTLKLDREDEQYIYLKLSIDSLILKLFTSSLDLKYNKSERRLIQYSGLSNISNDQDEMQNVVIDYKYN